MTDPTTNPVLGDSAALLIGYGFDLGAFEVEELVSYWLSHYPPHWLRAAILEALHQGRYKAISVGQILVIWRRRGQPLSHYSYEFERAVCQRFPLSRSGSSTLATATSMSTDPAGLDTELVVDDESGPESDSAAPAPGTGDIELAIASPDGVECPVDQPPENAIAVSSEPKDLSQDIPPIELTIDLEDTVDSTPADLSAEDNSLELWGRASSMHLPIHQYVPIIPRFETSTFYAKLRAVAASDETS